MEQNHSYSIKLLLWGLPTILVVGLMQTVQAQLLYPVEAGSQARPEHQSEHQSEAVLTPVLTIDELQQASRFRLKIPQHPWSVDRDQAFEAGDRPDFIDKSKFTNKHHIDTQKVCFNQSTLCVGQMKQGLKQRGVGRGEAHTGGFRWSTRSQESN